MNFRAWYLVHKWTSLVSTVFLLMLCLTGLPLIFHEEIDHWLNPHPELAQVAPDAAPPSIDTVVARTLAERPGEVVRFVTFDDEDPLGYVITAPTLAPPPEDGHVRPFDARTGELFDPLPPPGGFMDIMLSLHTDMYLGLPGYLFLGFMGVLLVVATITGLVIYTPFMRKLAFGTVRGARSTRVKWLDLHNLLGVATLAWVLVVGATGVINTLALPILGLWQSGQLAEMTAPYRGLPPLAEPGSVDAALRAARRAAPDMTVSFVAYPGTQFSSRHHYAVFMHGDTPLTSRIIKPALVDARTGALTDMRDLPLYVRILLVSQPLHFGDYGGLPLKIIWAVLDVIAILILGSGLYLWLRRPAPAHARAGGGASGVPAPASVPTGRGGEPR